VVRLLAIETATELVGAALAGEEGITVGWRVGRRLHSESLAPIVQHICNSAGVALRELDAVAVDVGPGLFTGLRVGVAMANGLALALDRPVLGASSLDILAAAATDSGWPGEVLAVIDARRGQVFVRHYAGVPLMRARLASPGELGELVSARPGPVLAVGDGALRYRDVLESSAPEGGIRVAGTSLAYPPPAALAALASGRADSGALPPPGKPVEPVYLRSPDVRIGWSERAANAGVSP
jgi:tRNA threonylcarbamoyladenosine biosynthesis protein TsaB